MPSRQSPLIVGFQMGRIKVYNDNYANSTAVSNSFIDIYMTDANDAQLKVYLYLLRVLGSGMSTSVSDMADRFNHTEKDIMRALKYWEKKKLLSLEYADDQSLSGIHLFEMNALQTETCAAPAPVVSIASHKPDPYTKPEYSLDQLKEFKNREDTAQLLFIAEQYIGKTLSATEIRSIFFMSDQLGFSEDLIDYLLQYCVGRGKKDFRYIEKVAISWAKSGVTTPKEAEQYAYKYDRTVYAIMNALGKSTAPTNREVNFINRWTNEYGFTQDIILEACERTVLATDKHRFEYADGILSNWKQNNVHEFADIARLDAAHQKKKAPVRQQPANKFNHILQNQYDFEALEQELLSN